MDPVVFLEKVRRPDRGGLVRHRLEHRLCSPSGPTVGLVLGPAGTGKTTLLSSVASGTTVPSAWYRASSDDDEASLVSHLAVTLGSALADQAVIASGRTGLADALLTSLEDARCQGVHLVVDDLHEVAGTDAERALERFISLRPRSIRILLGSRRPPAINTSRLLVSGELSQLGAEDLRFRTWEVEELFRDVYQQPLSPEAAATLARRTGGWAAGLQLFHLATITLTHLERERAVTELNGRSRLIRSYLTRNVLDGLDSERRSFLLRTSTLGVLTARACDELLDTTGSAAVLQDLEQQQFFTTSTDGGLTYRYHQVLQTHLEVLLADEFGTTEARELYSRSGTVLEDAGHISAAVRAHARAEDWGTVARLLQQTSSSLPTDEPLSLAGLPGLAPDDPGIAFANARRMFRSGRVAEAVAGFRLAESLLDDPEFGARCALERAVAVPWLPEALVPGTGQPRPQDRRLLVSRELRFATQTVLGPSSETGLVGGIRRLLAGDATAAVAELRRPLSDPGPDHWEMLATRLAAQLADLHRLDESAAGQLEEIVLAADLEALPWLSRVARGLQYAVLATTHPLAARWLASGQNLVLECQREGDRWACCILALTLGAACILSGDDKNGAKLLRIASETAAELQARVLQAWAESLAAVVATRCHQPGAAAVTQLARARARAVGVDLDGRLTARLGARVSLPTPRDGGAPSHTPRDGGAPSHTPRDGGAPSHTRLVCLGSFEVVVGGAELAWHTLRPRAQALLMLLAMQHRHAVHREVLIDTLWPDAALNSGIRSLHVAVSSVRHCLVAAGLTDETLQRHGHAYALCLPDAVIQLEEFEGLSRRAVRLERAGEWRESLLCRLEVLDLYTGDLLPEVGPTEWVVPERDRLRGAAARVGADAARVALRLGELSIGVRAAQRSVELDPYHDRSWDLLVEGFERLGDHSAAAVSRRGHSRACAELGIETVRVD